MASILCSRQTIISPLFFPLFLNPSPSSSRFRKSSSHSRPRFRVRSDGRAIKFLKPCGSSNYPNPREKPIIEKIACSNFYNGDEKCVPISSKLETEEKVSALKVHRKSLSLNRVAESGFVGVGCVKKNNVVKDALKRVALVLFFVAVGLRPVQSFQVCAFAATTVVDVEDREPGLRDHEYSHYTRELLEKVSGLVRSVEAARKGSGDLKDVEAALRIVKLKNEELEEKIMDGLHTELKELDMEKEELQKRAYEILKVALKEKREHGKLFRKVISGNAEQGLKERMMSLGESIARMVEDYNAILQRVGEFEDQILRKKTMALSIGVREISFIERESEQLVNELRKEMRQMGSNRMPKSSLTKSARSDIKKELETAQRRYWEQIILPGVVETEELGVLFDQNYMDFAKRIKNSLEESRELQRNLEAHIRKKMERFGDEKLFVVSTPPHEVVKGFPEVELKWMFGNKEVVVPDAVSLDMFHGWNRWREETKADLKRNLLENNDIGRQYAAKRQERILLDRDRVVSKTWYNEERSRWEMDPIAIPYAASKKLIKRARIRHDWAAMYVVLKGDEKEYYIDIKEYEMLFEDFGGFDALYLKMIACGIPTAVQFMWIPFSELDIQQQFLLAMRLSHLCLNGLWKTKVVSHAKEWAFENIKNINDDLMMMIVFPIIEFIIPFPLRIHLGMAWPEETYQSVGSTWYLKWQSEAEMSFRSRKSDNFLWYLWFLIRSFLYGYILFRVTRFMRRKVSKLLGYEPLHREPNLQKLQRLKFYFNYKMRKVQSLRKAGLDPIRAAFDQMKRVKNPPIRLEDFASIDSIREEINEVVAFLQNPSTFQEVGARAPRGILIVGETGTGKTSLALAIAAKARVPLVEVKAQQLEAGLWVGQSASNVRELFQTARDLAPVIIFIEDFDLFAGVRGKFIHTGKQDHEAFINQLLVELDGFEKQNGVVLMATTRNLKKIDEALQRPGRMDRIFHLQRPTQTEREKILMISAKETMDDELINFVDWRKVAEKTALLRPIELKFVPVALECSAFRSKFLDKDELMNYCSWFATFSHLVPDWVRKTQLGKKMSKMLVNHLGLTLAREDLQNVVELMEPYGQISNGIELVNPPLDWTREVKLPHSVWAAGRGLVAVLLPNFDIVDNIWLEPLSWQGIGCTKITKARNQGSINGNVESRSYLEKKLVFCFGSHVASQLLLPFGEENFLSSSELKQAQEIATRMVIQYGWDPHGNPSVYYHGSAATALSMGNDLEFEIAAKIEKVYHLAYDRAKEMLQKNLLVLQKIVDELLEFEILTEKDLQRLVKENGGIREKEPFHLSEDYYEEQTLSSSFLDGVNSSPTALLGAPNNKST